MPERSRSRFCGSRGCFVVGCFSIASTSQFDDFPFTGGVFCFGATAEGAVLDGRSGNVRRGSSLLGNNADSRAALMLSKSCFAPSIVTGFAAAREDSAVATSAENTSERTQALATSAQRHRPAGFPPLKI